MRRYAQKVMAVVIGLVLGWVIAGVIPGQGLTFAEGPAGRVDGHGHEAVPHPGDAATDAAFDGARRLVPQAGDFNWYKPVLAIGGGLFVVAAVLGPLVRRVGSPPDESVSGPGEGGHGH